MRPLGRINKIFVIACEVRKLMFHTVVDSGYDLPHLLQIVNTNNDSINLLKAQRICKTGTHGVYVITQ